ncbi:MAG: DNA recombination protein RmuC [Bacteroidota bacterium]
MSELVYLLVGLVIGSGLTFFVLRRMSGNPTIQLNLEDEKRFAVLTHRAEDLQSRLEKEQSALNSLREELNQAHQARVRAEKGAEDVALRLEEHRSELEQVRAQMKEQFAAIASDVVMRNANRIQDEHKSRLEDVLNPLRERIERFEQQVTKTNEDRMKEHVDLRAELNQLQTLNRTIGDEARNLVSALKGQTKIQGNWGEMILERILESSGLVKGREYQVQASFLTEDGKRLQPDVVLNLPENRSIVIDSKVSLIAYERYCNSSDEAERIVLLREHMNSLRKHIKDLSGKNYQGMYALNTLDFVLLFVPIEPAFSLAVEHDAELFNEAFKHNIVIVTTSTLLATLRTIASIWRIEHQNKNAIEIARQSGDLYDKFCMLIDEMIIVGKKLQDAQTAYEETMKRLHTGNGNLIARTERLKKLGAKTHKQINPKLIERTEGLDIEEPATEA